MIDEYIENRIGEILEHSPLSEEDRNLWRQKLSIAAPLQISLFISLCAENPVLLELMTSNLKKKISALRSTEVFADIFQEERLLLQNALKN